MSRSSISIALSILAAMTLAACSEKPPRADPEGGDAYRNEMPQHPVHERTRNQGESERIGS
jgi:hypothetical protein